MLDYIDCSPQLHLAAIHASVPAGTLAKTMAVPGIGVLCIDKKGNILGLGTYNNSIGRTSDYAIAGRYLAVYSSVSVGVIAGAVTGYQEKTMPMIAAVVTVNKNYHLTIIPPYKDLTPLTVQLSVSF
jgi:hypothetical protein